MHNKIALRAVVALGLLSAAPAGAQAQSAAQYNRAAQAMQICASAAGAMIPECAQLRGMVGGAAAPAGAANLMSGLGVGSGAKGATAAGLLGIAAQALAAQRTQAAQAAQQQTAPAPAMGGFPGAPGGDYGSAAALATLHAGQAYQACVMRVGATNAAGVQGCIAQMQVASAGAAPSGFPGAGFPVQAPAGFPGAAQTAPAAAALAPAAINAFSAMLGGR